MNKVLKNDLMEIVKTLKRTNKREVKIQCIKDYNLFMSLISCYYPNETINSINIDESQLSCDIIDNQNEENIKNDIINNLDSLLDLYEQMITLLNNYKIDTTEYIDEPEELEFSTISDFLFDYPGFNDIFNKIINSEHLVFIEGSNASYTYVFPSINKEYIFANIDNLNETLSSIVHEIGHVYQQKITYNNSYYHFLIEFIPILMEHLYFDYYKGINNKTANKLIMNRLNIWKKITMISYAQLKIMKEHPDAFNGLYLNPKYKEEFEKICGTKYNFQRYSLYAQFYSIGFMAAVSYYYALKYGMEFYEIDKFFLINGNDYNLTNILNSIDFDALKEYLKDNISNNNKKKKKV